MPPVYHTATLSKQFLRLRAHPLQRTQREPRRASSGLTTHGAGTRAKDLPGEHGGPQDSMRVRRRSIDRVGLAALGGNGGRGGPAQAIIGGVSMKRQYSLSFVTSIVAIVTYLTCALLAFSRYPLPYSPMSNWLSDLGNGDVNPGGALFYNIGIVTTGVLLVLFFLGLPQWRMSKNRIQRLMLFLTQGFGILGAFAMVMTGLYPINHFAFHSFFSTCSNILLGTAFAFSVAALRYHASCPRWLLVLGAVTMLADLLFGISKVVTTIYVLEWVTIALFISYFAALGVWTQRHASETWIGLPQPLPT